jgi:hypothetical protein
MDVNCLLLEKNSLVTLALGRTSIIRRKAFARHPIISCLPDG